MKTLNKICKKDGKYVKVIQELTVVKNAIQLLGGRRKTEGGGVGNEEAEEEEEKEKEKNEGRGGLIFCELRVQEKIGLLELLSGLVKRGVEMEEEEELKEVGMELEEEGNKHVEEEDGELGEEENREWEELSEKARNLVWIIEKKKARLEGKKSETLRMLKKMKKKGVELEEANERLEEANGRLEEENAALKAELGRSGKKSGRGEGEGEEKKAEKYGVNRVSEIKLLGEMRVLFGDWSILRRENNSIIHNHEQTYASSFVGENSTVLFIECLNHLYHCRSI